jgi:hypothetical protein
MTSKMDWFTVRTFADSQMHCQCLNSHNSVMIRRLTSKLVLLGSLPIQRWGDTGRFFTHSLSILAVGLAPWNILNSSEPDGKHKSFVSMGGLTYYVL